MRKSIVAVLFAVSVLLSSADASADVCAFDFYPEVTYGAGSKPGDVASGDFNNDGFDDLAVVNRQSLYIAILLGRGDGTFASAILTATTGANQGDIVAAHMNGDANLDLVVMGGTTGGAGTHVQVLLGTGSGGFRPGDSEFIGTTPYHLAAGDFDNDGDTDIAVTRSGTSAGFNLLLNSGGVLTQKSVITSAEGTSIDGIGVGDMDADGKLDVAVTSVERERVFTYFGVGDGTFIAGPVLWPTGSYQGPSAIAVADMNLDGADDLIIATRSPSGMVLAENLIIPSNGSSRTFGFVREHGYRTGQAVPDLLVHDLNSDGYLDIVVATDSHVYVYPTSERPQLRYSSGGTGLALLDVDKDGGGDLAVTHLAAGTVGILQNVCGVVTIDFTSSANPEIGGTPVTMTATASSRFPATGTLILTSDGGPIYASTDLATSPTASFTITLGVGTWYFIAHHRGDSRHLPKTVRLTQVMENAPFGAPPGFTATGPGGAPQLSWIPTTDTSQYEIFRNTGSGYQFLATAPHAVYTDRTAPANAAVLYKVRAISTSGAVSPFSAQDFTTTHYLSAAGVSRGYRAYRVYLTQLRQAADAARVLAGLGTATWTDPVPTVIRAVHINELRTAINQARTAMGLPASTFSDPTVGTTTPIRATHISEPCAALR